MVRFDAYRLDALPRGTVVLIYNDDVPGVIGAVGTCLGRHQVNICVGTACHVRGAPRILDTGEDVAVVARHGDEPVAVQQGRILGLTFHPELTDDLRLHKAFLELL